MTSIGETLRRERQRRNLDLSKIAAELKISQRFLDAMEHDEFAKLPGGVFTKSFVRQYASFLGLEGDEMVAEVGHLVEPEPAIVDPTDKSRPDVPGIQLEQGEERWQSVRDRPMPLPSWFKSGVLLVVLMVVCSGVYWWFQRPHRPVLAHETPPVAKTAAPQPTPPPVAAPPQPAPAEPSPTTETAAAVPTSDPARPAADQPAASATPTPSDVPKLAPNPNASVRVGITADEPVWMRADVNGKYEFSGTLQAHETRNIDADGQVTLRLGNAGGVTITLNGKPVGEVGPKGQIRTVQFTSGGFQIESAPKLLDPFDRL